MHMKVLLIPSHHVEAVVTSAKEVGCYFDPVRLQLSGLSRKSDFDELWRKVRPQAKWS